jgi:hypothetical protein
MKISNEKPLRKNSERCSFRRINPAVEAEALPRIFSGLNFPLKPRLHVGDVKKWLVGQEAPPILLEYVAATLPHLQQVMRESYDHAESVVGHRIGVRPLLTSSATGGSPLRSA